MNEGSQDFSGSEESERPTVPVREAAVRLGLSPVRVHQLLDDENAPLDGPPRPGRGRGHVRHVYVDTLEPQRQRRRARRREGGSSRLKDLEWSVRQLNAVNEALHKASAKEAEAFRLQREAMDRMIKALGFHVEANAELRRADLLRSEVLGVHLGPDDPGEL